MIGGNYAVIGATSATAGEDEVAKTVYAPVAVQGVLQIVLRSVGDFPELVVGRLVDKFRLTPTEEQKLLSSGHGTFTTSVPQEAAQAAFLVLGTLGLDLAFADAKTDQAASLFDLSIRVADHVSIKVLGRTLLRLGWSKPIARADFFGPTGLEICDMTEKRAKKYAQKLHKICGVSVTLCSQDRARYDVMIPPGLSPPDVAALHEAVSAIGSAATPGHGMLAIRLDRMQLAALKRQFPQSGLIGINRAFGRFNFTATGLGAMTIEDYAKFVTRYGRATGKAVAKGLPQRLETNLPIRAARLLYEEYQEWGLDVRTEVYTG